MQNQLSPQTMVQNQFHATKETIEILKKFKLLRKGFSKKQWNMMADDVIKQLDKTPLQKYTKPLKRSRRNFLEFFDKFQDQCQRHIQMVKQYQTQLQNPTKSQPVLCELCKQYFKSKLSLSIHHRTCIQKQKQLGSIEGGTTRITHQHFQSPVFQGSQPAQKSQTPLEDQVDRQLKNQNMLNSSSSFIIHQCESENQYCLPSDPMHEQSPI